MAEETTKKRFKQVYIEITNRCNLTCAFCPRTDRPLADMDPALFSKIIEELRPITEQVYLHVMGEPLMHPEFPGLIRICSGHELPVAITTNGSLLFAGQGNSLLNPVVRRVNISLDSLDLEDDGALDEILTFTKQAFECRPDLYINYRLWNLAAFSEGLESDRNDLTCQRIEDAFGITIPRQGHSSGRKSLHLLNRLYLHMDTRFEWPDMHESKPKNSHGFCHALGSHFAILVDGTVVPCCLDHNGITALGNCLEQSINSILESSRSTAILKGFNEGRLVEPLCQNCTFINRFASRARKRFY